MKRPRFWTRRLALGSTVTAVLLAAGCSGEPTPAPDGRAPSAPRRGGTAVFGSYSDIGNWNEYLTTSTFDYNVLRRVYLRLAAPSGGPSTGPDQFEPQLAESWSFSDDRKTLTFTLRDARWSDGIPVTAEDVRFTWQAQVSGDVPWAAAATKASITDVEVVDPRTVIFHFDRVYAYQLADAVEGGILPRHVFGEVPFDGWLTHDWSTANVASGPFVPAGYRPQEQITLERNREYWREGFPRLDRVVIRVVPDSGSLVTQLRAGDIHYMDGLAPRDAASVADDPRLTVIPFEQGYAYIGWNAARPPFDDRSVRRALTLATDRRELVDDLLQGFGRVGAGPIRSTLWAASDALEPWPHDPARARELLAAAGFGPDAPLRFSLATNTGNALREAALVKLQGQFAQVGVEVDVETLEGGTLRTQVWEGDYDAYIGGWVFSGKIDLRSLFGSDQAPPVGMNMVRYRSTETDRWLDAVDSAVDTDALKTAYDGVQRQIHADQPYTFLFENPRIAAHRESLRGVRIDVPSDPWSKLEEYWLAAP